MPGFPASRGLLTALLIFAGLSPLSAQPSTCVPQLIGADRRGPAQAISRSGNTLYLGAGAAVVVVDTTNLLNPVERAYVNLDELVLDVAHWQTTAIALVEHGLSFIDASDPAQPEVVGAFPFPAGWVVETVTARDDLAYVPEANGLHVLDVSDPTAPVEIGGFPASNVRDVVFNGNRAYLLVVESILVLDISNPAAPSQIASVPISGEADSRLSIAGNGGRLAAFGGWCYHVHCGTTTELFSLANPSLPTYRSSLRYDEWYVEDVEFAENRVYVGEFVYYAADLSNPVYIGSIAPLFWARDMARTSELRYLLVADPQSGLHVAEVLDPVNPQIAASIGMPEETTDGYVAGTLGVVLHRFGLRSYELSSPSQPLLLGSVVQPGAYFESVTRVRDHAYATANEYPNDEIRIFDLSDPSLGQQVGAIPWRYERPVTDADLLFVYESSATGVAIHDVTDPASPVQVSAIGLRPSGFAASGRRLHLWQPVGSYPNYQTLLHGFDVTNPASPIEVGTALMPYHSGSGSARGNRLLLAEWDRLEVLDVRSSSAPVLVGSLALSGTYSGADRSLTEYGSMALVTTPLDYWSGSIDDEVRVIDISDPASPVEVASLDTPGDGRGVFAGPGLIVVADGPAGFSIFSSCVPFADGFESGDTAEWSDAQP